MYTATPVMATYNQIGHVIRASFLCLDQSPVNARYAVNKIKGNINPAKGICVNRII